MRGRSRNTSGEEPKTVGSECPASQLDSSFGQVRGPDCGIVGAQGWLWSSEKIKVLRHLELK